MNNKTKQIELTQDELFWLEEYLADCLKDDLENEAVQAFYIKVKVALGGFRSAVEREIEQWVADFKRDREYEEELAKLKEKYYPKVKAA